MWPGRDPKSADGFNLNVFLIKDYFHIFLWPILKYLRVMDHYHRFHKVLLRFCPNPYWKDRVKKLNPKLDSDWSTNQVINYLICLSSCSLFSAESVDEITFKLFCIFLTNSWGAGRPVTKTFPQFGISNKVDWNLGSILGQMGSGPDRQGRRPGSFRVDSRDNRLG